MSKRPRDASVSSLFDHTGPWLFPGAESHNGVADASRAIEKEKHSMYCVKEAGGT